VAATSEAGEGASSTAGGRRLVIWDGGNIAPRVVGVGRAGRLDFWDGGKGWADCDSKPECNAALVASPGVGVEGHKGLKFHGSGTGWIGCGWSWFDWYPPTAGTDLSSYTRLTFQIRVEAVSPDASPDTAHVDVSLVSSGGRGTSARVPLHRYDASFDDGKWHRVCVPLAALAGKPFAGGNDGTPFDPRAVWEFRLSTWSPTHRDFNVYIDRIAAED